jgi:hypothetical protein
VATACAEQVPADIQLLSDLGERDERVDRLAGNSLLDANELYRSSSGAELCGRAPL